MVPFFGDQPFWGEQVHARGAGPAPIPVHDFSLEKLVAAINYMLDPEVFINSNTFFIGGILYLCMYCFRGCPEEIEIFMIR